MKRTHSIWIIISIIVGVAAFNLGVWSSQPYKAENIILSDVVPSTQEEKNPFKSSLTKKTNEVFQAKEDINPIPLKQDSDYSKSQNLDEIFQYHNSLLNLNTALDSETIESDGNDAILRAEISQAFRENGLTEEEIEEQTLAFLQPTETFHPENLPEIEKSPEEIEEEIIFALLEEGVPSNEIDDIVKGFMDNLEEKQ